LGDGLAAPADPILAADSGAFAALCAEHAWMSGVDVAPPQVGVELAGDQRLGHQDVRISGQPQAMSGEPHARWVRQPPRTPP
jgi:hypothetical protein